jgi:hypothetical protein
MSSAASRVSLASAVAPEVTSAVIEMSPTAMAPLLDVTVTAPALSVWAASPVTSRLPS